MLGLILSKCMLTFLPDRHSLVCATNVLPVDIVKWLHGNRMSTVGPNCSSWVTLGVPVAATTNNTRTIEWAHLTWNVTAVNAPAGLPLWHCQSDATAISARERLNTNVLCVFFSWSASLLKIQNLSFEIQFLLLLLEASVLAVAWRDQGIRHREVTSPKAGRLKSSWRAQKWHYLCLKNTSYWICLDDVRFLKI